MTTLIAVYGHDGCEGRCDAKCYNAQHPECDCVCGGANHGKGLAVATANTAAMAEGWIERYAGEKGLQRFRSEISPAVYQGSLFDGV